MNVLKFGVCSVANENAIDIDIKILKTVLNIMMMIDKSSSKLTACMCDMNDAWS